ncbi:hypothetical protein PIB30_101974, partial [Stylosanthes scabra]|nr:hypothetical protein [Stylosanthes scabra]
LKCKSVEDLIRKLYAFKKVLHHNDAMNHHLVKDQSKWKGNGAAAPPSGAATRPEIAKFTITEATARPHHLNGAFARLARPRCELGHIRPKLHKCVARSLPSIGARARPCVRTMAMAVRTLALGALGPTTGRTARPRPSDRALAMDRKRKSKDAKRKGKLAMPPTRKSPRLAGLLPFVPPTSPKSVLRPNKLLVLAIAAARGEPNPKAQASAQATVEKPPADVKGKKAARISMKPLRKWLSQRIIARGGPSRPKPKKAMVIDLVSDEEKESRDKETATEEPPLVANQAEEEEEEDPKEYLPPYSPLPPFPPSPELGPGEYDDPHNWNYDGDLDQWGTNVVEGEPAAAHD